MNIKKIIREEIKKLDESVESDLVLPKGKKVVLRADNPEVNRGLIVTWLEKGGYNVEYWYKDPSKIYPAEVKIDGESITKDGKIVYVGYHPKLDETISVTEATVTFRGARGRSVVVPNEYVSKLGRVEHKLMKMLGYTGGKHNIIADWSWGYNSRQKMKPNDEFSSSIILRSHPYIKGGRRELKKGDVKTIIVTLNKLLRASGLKIEKPKYRPDVNYPMIEFRVKPNQFKESVEEERDYKTEYKKYGSSTKAKKYRAELNQYNRKNGTYGNGDGKDASHKGGKIVGFEKESTNRGRAEKSRLKKESVNEGSLNWEKNFPGFNKQEYRVIQRLIAMNSKHIDGEIRQYKKNPKAYKRMIKKFLKRFPRLRRESVNESNLITEGTRWFVGVEMPNGKTTSTYGHWDGYPSYTGKMLKRYYSGGAGKVRDLLKLGKHGISSLDKSMKGGKGHSFENPLPGETVFYGRDRGDKQRMVRNWKNKDSIKFNYYGAEFGYIWSVKDRKWYVKDDSSRADWKVL